MILLPRLIHSLLLMSAGDESTSTLKLTGSTDSAIKLPGLSSVSFDPFLLTASMILQPSVSLDSFELEGAGTISGIGPFKASFSYEEGSTALVLELEPNLPIPFEPNTTAIELTYTNEEGSKLEGVFRAAINLEGSDEPVEIESNMTFTADGFSFAGKTAEGITVPGLSCLALGEMNLNAELQVRSSSGILYA